MGPSLGGMSQAQGPDVRSRKRGRSRGGEMTCPRSCSRPAVRLRLALENAHFLVPSASRYVLGRQNRWGDRPVLGRTHQRSGFTRAARSLALGLHDSASTGPGCPEGQSAPCLEQEPPGLCQQRSRLPTLPWFWGLFFGLVKVQVGFQGSRGCVTQSLALACKVIAAGFRKEFFPPTSRRPRTGDWDINNKWSDLREPLSGKAAQTLTNPGRTPGVR